MSAPDRRRFLAQLLGGSAATLAAPSWLGATILSGDDGGWSDPFGEIRGNPDSKVPGQAARDEAYWERVKGQFALAPGLILMNAANLCPSPYPVQQAVFNHTRDVDSDASFQNRAKFSGLKEEARVALAAYVGASPLEIAITRNTSEGNNSVVNGLDLGPGDEVVLWDQNHPTNNVSWDVRAERWGFTVVRVTTPTDASTADELMAPFFQALTARTRVLSFSHLSNSSGILLPAKELCEAARSRGVLTLVDGAQTFGALKLNLNDMGCDFFTSSSHKWFVGPKEAGLMYVREESQERLWPSDVGVGWEGAVTRGAQKFESLGQRDDAAVVSMATTAAFHEAIGPEVVEARVRQLATAVMEAIPRRLPFARFHTPAEPSLRGGVVVFALPGADRGAVYQGAYESHRLGCASMGGAYAGIRISPHIYNTLDQVGMAVEALAANV